MLAWHAPPASAASTVSGPVAVNTVWRSQDGPFDVAGDITVQGGATLTIEAGTQVFMRPAASLIVQQGALRIMGTAAAPVLITSRRDQGSDTPAPGDWGNLRFLDGTSDAGTRLEHVVVRYGGGVTIERASPAFSYLAIEHNSGAAIAMDLASSPVGIGLTAMGNALDGVLVPPGEVLGDVVWGLVGIPYVVADGIVSVGAAPAITAIIPGRIGQGETITATIAGSRLAGAESIAFPNGAVTGTILSGSSDTAVNVELSASNSAPLGTASLALQVAAGKATLASGFAVVVPLPPISVTGLAPVNIQRAATAQFTATGTQLQGASVSSSNPGLILSGLQTTPTQVTFTVAAAADAPLGPALFSFSNPGVAKGIATVQIQVNRAPPKILVTPAVLAVPPDGAARQFRVGLTEADEVDRSFTLSVADTAVATVNPTEVTLAAGQTQRTVAVSGLKLGQTILTVSASGLTPLSLPIYVTADFNSINTAYARQVKVQREVVPQPPSPQTITPVLSRAVHLGAGRFVESVAPATLTVGTGPVELQITGAGLEGVSGVELQPAEGLTLGSASAAPDGRSVRVLVTVAGDAPLGQRQLRITGTHQPYIAATTRADRVLIVPPAPEIASIEPIVVTPGSTGLTFVVRGRNLQNLQALTLSPPSGITLGAVNVSTDGTSIATAINVAPGAQLGERLVRATTPAGSTSAVPGSENTLRVVSSISPPVTPVLSATARVLKVQPTAPVTATYGLVGREVRVASGRVAARVVPVAGSVGETLTLRVLGIGLQMVTAVELTPPDGLTLGAVTPAADGTNVALSLNIATDAPQAMRRVRVLAGAQEIPFVDAAAAQFRVTTRQPELFGISPINLEAGGSPIALTIVGKNLQNAAQVRVIPDTGISVTAPSVNSDGTQATVIVAVIADAALGPRAVTVVTPAGETSQELSPANTLTIARAVAPDVTPVLSAPVRLLKQTALPPPTQVQVGPTLSREVRINAPTTAQAAQWDLADNFSGAANPNGTWQYGYTVGDLVSTPGLSFTPFASRGTFGSFEHHYLAGTGLPSIGKAISANTLLPLGKVMIHPGNTASLAAYSSMVVWTAPASGEYLFSGAFEGVDSRGPNVSALAIARSQVVFTDQITALGDSAPFSFVETLAAGEQVRFAVVNNASAGDRNWTRLDVRITGTSAPGSDARPVSLHSRVVTAARGSVATRVQPRGLPTGSATTLVISGHGLNAVSALALTPSDGLSIGTPTATSDGTQLSATVGVDIGALPGPRELRLSTATGTVEFADATLSRIHVGPLPIIDSITPIDARRGEVVNLLVRGNHLDGIVVATVEPSAGVTVEPIPSIDASGTVVTVRLQIALDAPLGARVVRITTPVGTTQAGAAANNTITIFP